MDKTIIGIVGGIMTYVLSLHSLFNELYYIGVPLAVLCAAFLTMFFIEGHKESKNN